jgi:Methyltransferase domain
MTAQRDCNVPVDWSELVSRKYPLPWQMTPAERLALIALLNAIRPSCAIEVGVAGGGSLQVLSDLSERVYALDIDPSVKIRLSSFPNVEFITGDSRQTFPALLDKLHAERVRFDFVLIDGDHSRHGVRCDIQSLLRYPPESTTYVVLHDSFNPACREGMRTAEWAKSPYVRSVELDFIQGWYCTEAEGATMNRQMWGGFGLAILSPQRRVGGLEIKESQAPTFARMFDVSAHRPSSGRYRDFAHYPGDLARKAWRTVRRLLGPDASRGTKPA